MFDRSRRRLAVWFTLSMGGILILFAFTVYQRQITEQKREFDESIYARAKKIVDRTEYKQKPNWQLDTEKTFPTQALITAESNITCTRWYDAQKRLVKSFGQCSQFSFSTRQWRTIKHHEDQAHMAKLRTLTLPLTKGKFLVGYLEVTASMTDIYNSQKRSRLFLAFGIPITLGITGIVGWLLAGFAMRPVKRSYEQLQRFTADASHELRAPVAAILSNAQVGLLAPTGDQAQPRQRLENIVTQSKYMSDLITNLLFLARHQGQLNPQDVNKTNIVELLNSLGERYQTLAKEKGLEFELDISVTSKEIIGDYDLLQQAIGNLIDNATKYTPSGGIVALKLEIKPRRILITVQDTGIGIPQADLAHVFDRFYRVDKTRTRQTGGFGLGLAIAQQIIQAHNGKITVESEVDKGTTFQICLPVNSKIR
ncbi:MAG: HAMP domain-containing sensor histidine kinase [Cyanobacteria bacterium P01_G01_bin.39]